MGLFAFNRARRLALQAQQPEVPEGAQPTGATEKQAQQPEVQKPKRAKAEKQDGAQGESE